MLSERFQVYLKIQSHSIPINAYSVIFDISTLNQWKIELHFSSSYLMKFPSFGKKNADILEVSDLPIHSKLSSINIQLKPIISTNWFDYRRYSHAIIFQFYCITNYVLYNKRIVWEWHREAYNCLWFQSISMENSWLNFLSFRFYLCTVQCTAHIVFVASVRGKVKPLFSN